MLLDRYLTTYHFTEIHGINIRASRAQVYRALRAVSLNDMPAARILFALRSLPAILTGERFRSTGRGVPEPDEPFFNRALRGGFVLLADAPARELVLGTIGRFWQASGGLYRLSSPQQFLDSAPPGYAKSAINFLLYERDGFTRLRTETRILISDPTARRKFARYWAVVQPGSALIRRIWLGAIKKRAEQSLAC
jgi:hypothetical protein